jgi:hypothetical protein
MADRGTAAAKHGANIVLHHLGSSTEEQALVVQHTIQQLGRKCLLVSGDIAIPVTAKDVSVPELMIGEELTGPVRSSHPP